MRVGSAFPPCLCLIVLAAGAATAQAPAPALSAAEAVRIALEQSPGLAAAGARLAGARAALGGARAPYNLLGEVAPGAGFTNGNAALSQRLDIAGRRAAETRAARGQQGAAAAALDLARQRSGSEAREAYFDLVRALALEQSASDAAGLARQVRDVVRRRMELGQAPAVQVTRADLEVARAEQEGVRAGGEVRARLAALNVLLGRPPDTLVSPTDSLALPPPAGSSRELVEQSLLRRPELAAAQALVEARRGEVDAARADRRPDLFAELAADVWSLDRDPFRSRDIGFQARLSFPLFDRGRLRADVERARAEVRGQEADVQVLRRGITVEVERSAAELAAAREVALNYQNTILPRSQELLQATRSGFEIGLSSFLEVLEAQRLARQTRVEYLNVLYDAVRSRIALDRAIGAVPGAPVSPPVERR